MNNSHEWPVLVDGKRHKIYAEVARNNAGTDAHHISISVDGKWTPVHLTPVPPAGATYGIDVEGRRLEIVVEKGIRHLASLNIPGLS